MLHGPVVARGRLPARKELPPAGIHVLQLEPQVLHPTAEPLAPLLRRPRLQDQALAPDAHEEHVLLLNIIQHAHKAIHKGIKADEAAALLVEQQHQTLCGEDGDLQLEQGFDELLVLQRDCQLLLIQLTVVILVDHAQKGPGPDPCNLPVLPLHLSVGCLQQPRSLDRILHNVGHHACKQSIGRGQQEEAEEPRGDGVPEQNGSGDVVRPLGSRYHLQRAEEAHGHRPEILPIIKSHESLELLPGDIALVPDGRLANHVVHACSHGP
mmetsp:Transcript_20266/g.48020  ORF Transcript_20266/g.48020 Transcript_20266/m.48020 type:complete len:267 (-) Transcript_20266:726-1526(-)